MQIITDFRPRDPEFEANQSNGHLLTRQSLNRHGHLPEYRTFHVNKKKQKTTVNLSPVQWSFTATYLHAFRLVHKLNQR